MNGWTEESALDIVRKTCEVSNKVIKLGKGSTSTIHYCSAISYLVDYCGYKLI